MSVIKVNPELLKEIKKYGAFDISACFHCGNCTAVCPLVKSDLSFPRKMIRRGQLGLKEQLVNAAEPWLCYACGECSETCPKDAQPGEYMAALRRYQIAHFDPTGLSGLMFRSTFFNLFFTSLVAVVLAFFLLTLKGKQAFPHWLFHWIDYEVIHVVGIAISVIFGAVFTVAFGRFVQRSDSLKYWKKIPRALPALLLEIATMKRQQSCGEGAPFLLKQRNVHLMIMWGFIGLATATGLDFIFIYFLGFTVFYPARIIGTIAGLIMLAGVLLAIYKRVVAYDKQSKATKLSDAWVLAFLLVLAITGFWLETVVTVMLNSWAHELILLIHTAMAMELVLFFGFTKMAHIFYRPIYLLREFLKEQENAHG